MMKTIVIFALLVALVVANTSDLLSCGSVFDGPVKGVDVDFTDSTSKVFASWTGFTDGSERNRVLKYEWCVISENIASLSILDGECRLTQGFLGHPDVLGWRNTGLQEFGSASVGLSRGATYYIVVRATTSFGVQKYTNSNGFTVNTIKESDNKISTRSIEMESEETFEFEARDSVTFSSEDCPLNCNDNQLSVNDFLNSVYGPADFGTGSRNTNNIIFATIPNGNQGSGFGVERFDDDDNDDDDDDNLNTASVILIAIAITALCCVIGVFIVILGSFGGSSDKFAANVRRQENLEEF